ncbi:hypothetical protein BW14_07150 [Bifidobacterium sp. UTBIF-68]|uniref:hypothetical protein n=1 Tax=Bifidobacterium sp. UTBIF-68 TaxID=1465262 RepID=UPI00112E0AB4|nr:hypothetical protein [Bifidobacterium sp. UTBIF-68]TPF92930.1 hypothetical protein BW14_07150 [Bifidobacterium sp. UTBIF-68]
MTALPPGEQLELLDKAKNLLPTAELEQRARHILDEYTSLIKPEPPARKEPRLTISNFLRSKGFEPMKRNALAFGTRLAENYRTLHGGYPEKYQRAFVYYESDRPLMEETWQEQEKEAEPVEGHVD